MIVLYFHTFGVSRCNATKACGVYSLTALIPAFKYLFTSVDFFLSPQMTLKDSPLSLLEYIPRSPLVISFPT